MTDYGIPLQFGTFLTPQAADPAAVVALARESERLGYDLVTVQDHPYQPSFLDAWTLLTWIAASTERVQVAGNVLNLALRPPAILAKSAASLDRLAPGRVALGLGAGAFWDAIATLGASRRSPGEAVASLVDALAIIRGLWATDDGPLTVAGSQFQVTNAARGPAPAQPIPIWIGALKPRLLRLVGAEADGWSVSAGYLAPGEFRRSSAIIDAAAREAGRDPGQIRRLLNIGGVFSARRGGFLQGPPAQWIEELLPFVVEDGASTLVLASDDARMLAQFAQEVAPALREALARERATTPGEGSSRSSVVLAKRRPGIAYDEIPPSLRATALEPGDAGYSRAANNYMRGGSPGLILRPADAAGVVDAVVFAREHRELPLSVRSGGHGISGRSTNDGGLIIDLGDLNGIDVLDEATRRVRIEPGARWMEVAAALAPHGWALSSGDYGGVGVGGLATAGGVGWLTRQHGLTIDHLVAAELVLADGAQVRVSATEHPELFWAVRGAGANVGIVTAFEFEVDELGDVGWGQLVFDASDTAGFLERWGAAIQAAPRALTSFLIIGAARNGQPPVGITLNVVASDDPETIIGALQPLAEIAPLLDHQVVITGYDQLMANAALGDHGGRGEPIARSALLREITPEAARAMARVVADRGTFFFQIRAMGGAVGDVDTDATAFAHRDAQFSVAAIGIDRARLDALWLPVEALSSGLYLSFETDLRPERIGEAFPPRTLARLRAVKAAVDPTNLFRDNFNVSPVAEDASVVLL